MHQIIFFGAPADVDELEVDESPGDHFPCMSSQQFHRDARAQFYALVCGTFLSEAVDMELLDRAFYEDGPFLYRLDDALLTRLARLEEDDVERFAQLWQECEEVEALNLDREELLDFLFLLVHFCQTAYNGELGVFIYSDS